MATDLYFLPMTQVSSHWFSCGQTRPQTAGSAELARRMRAASRKSPSAILWMNPGMSISAGQLVTHCGFLQRRQRSASSMAVFRSQPKATSSKFRTRFAGSWCGISCRGMAQRSCTVSSFFTGNLPGSCRARDSIPKLLSPGGCTFSGGTSFRPNSPHDRRNRSLRSRRSGFCRQP